MPVNLIQKKMKILKLIILAIILNGCGLHYMSSNYHKVNYEQTPSVLQTKGEMISINLKTSLRFSA